MLHGKKEPLVTKTLCYLALTTFVFFGVSSSRELKAEGTLFGSAIVAEQLITIDSSTGAGTTVGSFGLPEVNGLAFDTITNTLYGLNESDTLVTLDPSTGAATVVGQIGSLAVTGLAFLPVR